MSAYTTTLELDPLELALLRSALHNMVTANSVALEAIGKLSQRQADLRKAETTILLAGGGHGRAGGARRGLSARAVYTASPGDNFCQVLCKHCKALTMRDARRNARHDARLCKGCEVTGVLTLGW